MTSQATPPTFDDLASSAAEIGRALIERGERVGVAESSTGGLVSAALLAMPGASAFYLGGSIIYTGRARGFIFGRDDLPEGTRGATEDYAARLALAGQAKVRSDWAISETGAAGPAGNPYGDPPGHSWVAIARPDNTTATQVVATGDDDRAANMFRFADAALQLLLAELAASELAASEPAASELAC